MIFFFWQYKIPLPLTLNINCAMQLILKCATGHELYFEFNLDEERCTFTFMQSDFRLQEKGRGKNH